jgi:hypothetical protein
MQDLNLQQDTLALFMLYAKAQMCLWPSMR